MSVLKAKLFFKLLPVLMVLPDFMIDKNNLRKLIAELAINTVNIDLTKVEPTQIPKIIILKKEIDINSSIKEPIPYLEISELNHPTTGLPCRMEAQLDIIPPVTKTVADIMKDAVDKGEVVYVLTMNSQDPSSLGLYVLNYGPQIQQFCFFAACFLLLIQLSWRIFGGQGDIYRGIENIHQLFDTDGHFKFDVGPLIREILDNNPNHPLHVFVKSLNGDFDFAIYVVKNLYAPLVHLFMRDEKVMSQLIEFIQSVS